MTGRRMSLEVIATTVPPEMLDSITSKPMGKATSDSITLRVRKAKAISLKREFDVLTFHNGESVDDFDARIGRITIQLAILGYEYKEEEVVQWFLLALPHNFE
jgi:hypothetical protein